MKGPSFVASVSLRLLSLYCGERHIDHDGSAGECLVRSAHAWLGVRRRPVGCSEKALQLSNVAVVRVTFAMPVQQGEVWVVRLGGLIKKTRKDLAGCLPCLATILPGF